MIVFSPKRCFLSLIYINSNLVSDYKITFTPQLEMEQNLEADTHWLSKQSKKKSSQDIALKSLCRSTVSLSSFCESALLNLLKVLCGPDFTRDAPLTHTGTHTCTEWFRECVSVCWCPTISELSAAEKWLSQSAPSKWTVQVPGERGWGTNLQKPARRNTHFHWVINLNSVLKNTNLRKQITMVKH